MFRLVDRYLIREMVFPFFLAVAGFVLFIFLNLIQQLSDFMLDRSLSFWVLVQLLLYRLPELLVYGLPVGVLFAIFWALGRLSHDKELIALQAAGYSLRRLMWPVFLMGALTTLATFAVAELWTPQANHQYYKLLREIFLLRSAPQMRESTFFKLTETATAYVERYDPATRNLKTILIFDQRGDQELQEFGGRFPKIVVAEKGSWDGEYWQLHNGKIHKLRDDGQFEYSVDFAKLSLYAGPYLERLFFEQRTPSEMSLREIGEQIALLEKSGLGAQSLIVEYHTKIAVPISAVIFALFGAPLSLIFAQGGAPRGRATGVIISVVLVACYQGLLLWTSTLGKRDLIAPALAPWIPNLLFGLLGLWLISSVDRWSRLDLFARLRRLLPLSLICCTVVAGDVWAQQSPSLEIQADRLTVARDWSQLIAEENVRFVYAEGKLEAAYLQAQRLNNSAEGPTAPALWQIVAAGSVRWQNEELRVKAQRLELQIEWDGRRWLPQAARLEQATLAYDQGTLQAREIRAQINEKIWRISARGAAEFQGQQELDFTKTEELSLELERLAEGPEAKSRYLAKSAQLKDFSGQTRFQSTARKTEILRFQGRTARATFDAAGRMKILELSQGEITTCTCPEPVSQAAYSIAASSLRFEVDDSVFAANILLKTYGVPVFWTPVYFASLQEETKNPLLPDFGQLPDRGWYLRWRFPFVIDRENTGAVLLDYYTKLPEIGTGIEYNYAIWAQRGRISLYRLVGRGESWAWDGNHQSGLPWGMKLSAGFSARTGLLERDAQRLFSRVSLSASWGLWRWTAGWSRDQNLRPPDEDGETPILFRFLERAPELTISLAPLRLGSLPFTVSLGGGWGQYREKKIDREIIDESTRWDLSLGLQSLALGPEILTIQTSANYRLSLYGPRHREAYDLTVAVISRPLAIFNADANYSYRLVLGQSPFSFDQLHLQNHLSLRANFEAPFRPNLTTGYDFAAASFDLLRLRLTEKIILGELNLLLEYDLNRGLWQRGSVALAGTWQALGYQCSTAYLFQQQAFEDFIFKFSWNVHRLSGSVDLNRGSLKRLNAETSWIWTDWEFFFKGEYDLWGQRFTALQVGIIRKFCQACWQMGLYSDGARWWLQAQINAFPTAKLSYSPTDQRLSFGR